MIKKLRSFLKKYERWQNEYDLCMAILSISIVITLIIDSYYEDLAKTTHFFDTFVWICFTIDYFVRFLVAENRFKYVRGNIVDLIAIIPFDYIFQGFRAIKLVKLLLMLRAFAYLNRAYKRVSIILHTNDFDHILWFTFCTICIGAISISFIDDMNIGDAFWWSFVTMTTVGYGDIAPSSFGGRLVAIFLMIIGIGFLSTLTGTISSFFIKNMDKPKNNNEHVNVIINQLSNFDDLTLEEIKEINAVLLSLKTVDKNKKI